MQSVWSRLLIYLLRHTLLFTGSRNVLVRTPASMLASCRKLHPWFEFIGAQYAMADHTGTMIRSSCVYLGADCLRRRIWRLCSDSGQVRTHPSIATYVSCGTPTTILFALGNCQARPVHLLTRQYLCRVATRQTTVCRNLSVCRKLYQGLCSRHRSRRDLLPFVRRVDSSTYVRNVNTRASLCT